MWKRIVSNKFSIWILLCILLFIPTLPLFHTGLPLTHDGSDHVARIANFYLSLSEGNLIPRWAENLNWGYGHPILMFLYPLPSYMASFFHVLGLSFVDSTKAVFGLTYILSGLTMFLWLKTFVRKDAAFLGALLYCFAPYRFVDFYVRGAIGEHVAFMFVPLVCYFILKTSRTVNKNFLVGGAFSLALLILSHNAVSLMALPFILLYILFLFFQTEHRKYFLLSSGFIIVLGFLLSVFFWVPAVLEAKYTLRSVVLKDQYLDRFSPLLNFFYSSWNYGESGQFSVQVGVIQWFILILGVWSVSQNQNKRMTKLLMGFLVFSCLFSVFLMTQSALFLWKLIPLIQQFQFPWRFLFVSVFTIPIIAGVVAERFSPKIILWFSVFAVLFCLGVQYPYWQAKGYVIKPETYYAGVYAGTTDTGESAPRWSVRFMEEYPKARMDLIGGKATIQSKIRTSTTRTYHISAQTPAQLRENTLYFPGWKVFVDSKLQEIEYQDPHNRGVMTFTVPQGEHDVHVVFEDTKLRLLANVSSLCALVIIGILSILSKRIWLRFL